MSPVPTSSFDFKTSADARSLDHELPAAEVRPESGSSANSTTTSLRSEGVTLIAVVLQGTIERADAVLAVLQRHTKESMAA